MVKDLVSIIVPVYNVEDFLEKCINSIIDQVYSTLEIIIVDDGSTDRSGIICDRYREIDSRVKVIHKKNEGQAQARNVGMQAATGKYVVFIDADDYIDADMINTLIEPFSVTPELSFTSCGYYNVFLDETISRRNSGRKIFLNRKEYEISLANNKEICFMLWNKMFKRSLLEGIQFVAGQLHEEICFMRALSNRICSVCYIDIPLYYYIRERVGNTKSKFRSERLVALKEFQLFEEEMIQNNNEEAANGYRIFQMEFIIDFYFECKNNGIDSETNNMKERFRELYALVKDTMSNRKRVKYFVFLYTPFLFRTILKIKRCFSKSKYIM